MQSLWSTMPFSAPDAAGKPTCPLQPYHGRTCLPNLSLMHEAVTLQPVFARLIGGLPERLRSKQLRCFRQFLLLVRLSLEGMLLPLPLFVNRTRTFTHMPFAVPSKDRLETCLVLFPKITQHNTKFITLQLFYQISLRTLNNPPRYTLAHLINRSHDHSFS